MLKLQYQKEQMIINREMKQLQAELEKENAEEQATEEKEKKEKELLNLAQQQVDWNALKATSYDVSRGLCIHWFF
jgi:hypothetical protein